MPDPFISVDDLAAYRKRSLDPADALALMAIGAACDELRRVAEQSIDLVVDDEVTVDSEGTNTLLLPELPAVDITSVIGPGAVELSLTSDVFLDREMGAVRMRSRARRFLPGFQLYTITYSHGYAAPESGLPDGTEDFPEALKALAVSIAARFYDQQGVKQESVGGYQAVFSSDEPLTLTDKERSLLSKIIGVGRRR